MDARSAVLGIVEMIDWNINFGNMLTIGMIVGGWAWTLIQMRNDGISMQKEITELKRVVEKYGSLATDNAVINNRLRNIEQDIHELRHGEGFVRGGRGIDREYP